MPRCVLICSEIRGRGGIIIFSVFISENENRIEELPDENFSIRPLNARLLNCVQWDEEFPMLRPRDNVFQLYRVER